MYRHYLKTAWRNTIRTISYSMLNILGLAIGMAVALLIGLWVHYQYSFDKYLPEHESIYRVQRNFDSNGDTLTFLSTSLKLADALRTQVPEIQYVAESDWMGSHGLSVGEKKLYMDGAIAGTDFFNIFQLPFIEGDPKNVFKDAYSIVLTQSTAKALFGNEDALNKSVRFENKNNLTVTGIIKDVPGNSSLSFNYVVPSTYIYQTDPVSRKNQMQSYSQNSLQIFIKLKPGISYTQVAPKIRNIEHTETGSTNAMDSYVTFQPTERWHLYSNYVNGQDTPGFLQYVKMFSIIGIFVLLIACINFINLTTARSTKRAKEVGVRKAIGSRKQDLIIQFLSETFLLTVIAFAFSILFVMLALPAFNALTGNKISIPFSNVYFWLLMLGCIFIITFLAGGRPAFYLSSFDPVKVLKGTVLSGKEATYSRKILVLLQFSSSIALIISTLIVYEQIQYAKNRPTGYNINRLISTPMNDELSKNFTALKNELTGKGVVSSIATATSPATDVGWHSDIDEWPGKNAGETVEMGTVFVSDDYFKTLNMKQAAGRNFTGSNDSTDVIFNEAAIKRLRIKDPVSKKITWNGQQYTIAGVVKDALMISPFASADPTMFFCASTPQDVVLYKLSANINTQDAIRKLTDIFHKYNPSYPYNYTFADADYAAKFQLEMLIGKLAGLFAALATLVSCLGLFGLAAYMSEQRKKEIGIRKVLGATIFEIWKMLSKDFIVLVAVSCFVAVPIAWICMYKWLQKYEYRTSINWWVLALPVLFALAITLFTVSWHTLRAARANPVKSLKTE